MTSNIARLVAILAALAAALFLSACTSPAPDGHTDHEHTEETVVTAQPAGYNSDDIAFATNMIPHHQQAVEMSALVLDRSTNPGLVKPASDIAAAQGPEIETMKVFLVQWKENPDTNTGSGHGGHGGMQGMVDDADHDPTRVAERHRVRPAVAGVDDRASPGRHRNGEIRNRQR